MKLLLNSKYSSSSLQYFFKYPNQFLEDPTSLRTFILNTDRIVYFIIKPG